MIGDVRTRASIEGEVRVKATLTADISSKCVIGDVTVGRVVIRKVEADPYEGEYIVTPSGESQILETENKKMLNDVQVKAIPYYDVSNEYGRTIYIGGDI